MRVPTLLALLLLGGACLLAGGCATVCSERDPFDPHEHLELDDRCRGVTVLDVWRAVEER